MLKTIKLPLKMLIFFIAFNTFFLYAEDAAVDSDTNATSPKAKSILQRIAERCNQENNCPEYIIHNKSYTNTEKKIIPSKKSTLDTIENPDNYKLSSDKATSTLLEKSTPPLTKIYFNPINLITEFTIKETASVGANNYPVSAVVPLKYGLYQTTEEFYLINKDKKIIPIQTEVLNRWWGKDNSIRHLLIHFNTKVEAFNNKYPNSGIAPYALYYGKKNIAPDNAITVTSTRKKINLSNNLISLNIQKKPLIISTPAGKLTSLFQKEKGTFDNSFNHKNIQFEIEENGPLRSIIKISSLTHYKSPTDIKHGWAIRIYAYANSELVKVDFQLQNSAINTALSAPLYFKSHILRIDNAQVSTDQLIRADEMPLSAIENLPLGVIHADNLNVILRNFWQTFPNGISTHTEGNIDIELWPSWSKQFHSDSFVESDIYWLDDMKQTYKEILFDFSGQSDVDYLQQMARTFQYPPVAVIPQAYYAKTKVTMNYGGAFPTSDTPIIQARIPSYSKDYYDPSSYGKYRFGMDNFGLDRPRRWSTSMAGGWPYSQQQFFVSGNPTHYYNAQDFAQAELNVRPQWLSGYKNDLHFSLLTPSTNPYGGNTWRRFKGHSAPTSTRDYLSGTHRSSHPRDDQHAWFYHVEHAYLMSGNKWIKDWYEFMAEFKKIYLSERDPYPDRSHRAEGEALAIALAAYKYTGNETLAPFIKNYIADVHNKYITKPHFIRPDPSNKGKISAFQLGYLLREFIGIYNEFPTNPETLATIRNYVQWNYKYGQFSYYKSTSDNIVSQTTSETSLSLVDSVIWFALEVQELQYADHAINYVEIGINNTKPYGNWSSWRGQFEAPMYRYYKQNIQYKGNYTSPKPIN